MSGTHPCGGSPFEFGFSFLEKDKGGNDQKRDGGEKNREKLDIFLAFLDAVVPFSVAFDGFDLEIAIRFFHDGLKFGIPLGLFGFQFSGVLRSGVCNESLQGGLHSSLSLVDCRSLCVLGGLFLLALALFFLFLQITLLFLSDYPEL